MLKWQRIRGKLHLFLRDFCRFIGMSEENLYARYFNTPTVYVAGVKPGVNILTPYSNVKTVKPFVQFHVDVYVFTFRIQPFIKATHMQHNTYILSTGTARLPKVCDLTVRLFMRLFSPSFKIAQTSLLFILGDMKSWSVALELLITRHINIDLEVKVIT